MLLNTTGKGQIITDTTFLQMNQAIMYCLVDLKRHRSKRNDMLRLFEAILIFLFLTALQVTSIPADFTLSITLWKTQKKIKCEGGALSLSYGPKI